LSLLRFITCGSVDDGKSTLIGRLLHDCRLVASDHLEALEADSRRHGRQGPEIDYSLLLDGLSSEREQGITIDVAYRYFSTPRRSFIVADTPGHEQYTRNMVTGASTADLALLLVDARKGILTQTRRHLHLAKLLGISSAVLVVNKMDLVDYDRTRFEAIAAAFRDLALGFEGTAAIPLSALKGDNLVAASDNMPWNAGPTLLDYLETVPAVRTDERPFRMPVQWVSRSAPDFRGFAGLIASGTIAPGHHVRVLPGGEVAAVDRIVTMDGDLQRAASGRSVTLTLGRELDCGRGSIITSADDPPEVADQFEATIIWMDEEPLLPGRTYLMKIGALTAAATVTELKHQLDVETSEPLPARTLELNAIGLANISLDRPIPFEPYKISRELGGFILIDRISNATAGAGMIHFALRRANNVHWQHLEVDRNAHASLKHQRPKIVWFTGLSGAGKSTIANLVEKKLHHLGRHTFLLDGDNLRHGLNRDLGFSDAHRVENIRRAGEVARLMADAGLIVLCAFISPFRAERRMVRELMAEGEFLEVFVDVSLAEAERRDPKGLYRKARAGEIPNFTGIGSQYEQPENADIHIDTAVMSPEEAADLIVKAVLG
jgi:bifunctional enzyme CysN/CysC